MEDQIAIGFGTYTVVVRDINGCQASNSATLYNPPELTGYISSTEDVLCFGDSSASIDLSVNGGTGPYLFAWTSNHGLTATTEDLVSIPVGSILYPRNRRSMAVRSMIPRNQRTEPPH